METVKIGGIVYKVVENKTPEMMEATGHPNTATQMRKAHISHSLTLQRPRGTRYYWTVKRIGLSHDTPKSY